MDELEANIAALLLEVEKTYTQLKLDDVARDLQNLRAEMAAQDFWHDADHAKVVSIREAQLSRRLQPWFDLRENLRSDLEVAKLHDGSLAGELHEHLGVSKTRFAILKDQLKLSGPYDDHDAILSIHAGAGGTDAQDWAQMLLRMYVRYAEQHGLKVDTIDESAGDEAGIKSVTIELSGGDFVYGKLQGEHGVHRLVRLSPFNADSLRQTSFAKVEIMPKIDAPEDVAADDKDLKIVMAVSLFCSCERSFWIATTMPVGKCVMRTAESVVLTLCPPWPPLR